MALAIAGIENHEFAGVSANIPRVFPGVFASGEENACLTIQRVSRKVPRPTGALQLARNIVSGLSAIIS